MDKEKKEIIKENWHTIEKMEEAVKKQTGDEDAKFNRGFFFFDDVRKLVIPINYKKKIKRKGKMIETKKTHDIMCFAKYCPFTGKPLYKNTKE